MTRQRGWDIAAIVGVLALVAVSAFAVGQASGRRSARSRSTAIPLPVSTTTLVATSTTVASTTTSIRVSASTTTSRPGGSSTTVPRPAPTVEPGTKRHLDVGVLLANSYNARSCSAPDVVPPRRVAIKDAAGKVVKSVDVRGPYLTRTGPFDFCTYPFTVDLPDSVSYTFVVDGGTSTTISRDEMAAKGWRVVLVENG